MLNDITVLDMSFINKIQSFAYLPDVTPVAIPVTYLNPEEEFVIEEFPSIIVYRITEVRDGNRIFLPKFRSNYVYDVDNKLDNLSERESPLPINFLYVIRLYYTYQEDGAVMNLLMLKNLPPQPKPCYLTIDNVDYDLQQISHTLLRSEKDDFGLISFKDATDNVNSRRVFCDQYMYYCLTDLDIFDKTVVKTVKEILISERRV